MNKANINIALATTWALLLWTHSGAGQLPAPNPGFTGTAGNYTALARGFTAVSLNPAGLAMPGTPSFSLALLPVKASQTLDPISLSDLANYEGRIIPPSVKESWLERITAAGGESGGGMMELTGIALNYDLVGFQVSTVGSANTLLNDAAAELLLFGNAGRTASPEDFDLQGSSMDGFWVTTAGLSVGIPLDVELVPGIAQAFALGVTLKRSWGHALILGEDAGSFLTSDPLEVDLEFPVLHTDVEDGELFSGGSGMGMDLGASWESQRWAAAAVIQNLFSSFEWDLDQMVYRPGEALFNDDVSESDFEELPSSQAPAALRDRVNDLTFEPVLALGAAYAATENLTLTSDLRRRLGDGLDTGPKTHIGMGVEYRPAPFLPLWAGVASVTGGYQIGGGIGLGLGPVRLGFSGLYRGGNEGEGTAGMAALSFGGD